MKSDYHIITATVEVVKKVVFNYEYTADEARAAYLADDYEDILDEEETGVQNVIGVEPVVSESSDD